MTCHETRERLSGWLDEALDARERAEVRAHLDGCPDCRRELERLEATVRLLARVERPRAPVGFVDRVMAAARPVPWHRRLGRWLFLPLGVKLPAEAAAMLLIAILGAFLFQRTPELQDATRSRVERLEPPAPQPEAQRAKPVEQEAPKTKSLDQPATTSAPASPADRDAQNAARDGRRRDLGEPSPPESKVSKQDSIKEEASADRLQKAPAPASPSQPAPPAAAPSAPPPAAQSALPGAKGRDEAESRSGALAPASPERSAKGQSAAGVFGRLNVKDRPGAEKGLADLLTRVGGREAARRQEADATVVEVLVPEARYAEFLRGLSALGAWTPEGQPTPLPTEPPQIRLGIRIQ